MAREETAPAAETLATPLDREVPLVVLGATQESLAALNALPDSVVSKAIVIDPSGDWIVGWRRRAARAGTKSLRWPCALHAGADPTGLRAFADKRGRQGELKADTPGFGPRPTAALLGDYHMALASRLPGGARAVLRDEAVAIEACGPRGAVVQLASGLKLMTCSIIFAVDRSSNRVPAWAEEPRASEAAARLDQAIPDGRESTPPSPAGPPPPALRVFTPDELDLSTPEHARTLAAGRQVVVVGGGATAAGLVMTAATAGSAAVRMVARRALVQTPWGCDPGWWGSKHQLALRSEADPAKRLAFVREGRRGTVAPGQWDQLVRLAAARRIEVLEWTEVAGVRKGTSLGLREVRRPWSGPTEFQRAVAAAVGGTGSVEAGAALPYPAAGATPRVIAADLVWLALGRAAEASSNPLLAELPTLRVVGGLPVLDDATLAVPGTCVHVVGRLATLSVGAAAGTPGGLRAGARALAAAVPRDLRDAGASASASLERSAAALELAASAAGTATPDVAAPALEVHKASVTKPVDRVDVSDLDAGIRRKMVERYSLLDEGFVAKVYAELPAEVCEVRSLFGPRSLDVWAVAGGMAHHLHIPLLWGRVLPAKCSAKGHRNKLVVRLQKEADAPWRHLRGYHG